MKKNTWVFYFFIILFTAIISLNLVWRFTPIRAEINHTIQERLKPYLGESFAMSDFSLGFGYMSFYNITIGNKQENYTLKLEEIQIGYSIHKLLYNKFDPLRVVESITIKNPHLIIYTQKNEIAESQPAQNLNLSEILTGLNRLTEIDRVVIKEGQILWGKNYQSTTRLVSELDGYLLMASDTSLSLNLQGRLFESTSKDLTLDGKIDLVLDSLSILADIKKGHLKESIPFLNSETFSLKESDISGAFRVISPSFNPQDLIFSGKISVQNMRAILFDQIITTDDFEIQFENQQMLLSPVSGKMEDGVFTLNGNLGSVFQPGLYFSIDFDGYSVKHLAISAPILELLNQGQMQGHLDINGLTSDILIAGKVYSSRLSYSIVPFYRTSLDFTFSDKIWQFQNIETYSIGMQHHGNGQIDFNKMNMWLNISSHRRLGAKDIPILDKLNDTDMEYFTVMQGDFPTLTFIGDIHGRFLQQPDSILATHAKFELIDNLITIQNYRSFPKGLNIFSKVENLWDNPTFEILEIKNIPYDSLSTLEPLYWLNKKYQGDIYFSGPVNFPSTKINFYNRLTKEAAFSFVGNAVNLIEPDLKFKGQFSLLTQPEMLKGSLNLENKSDFLSLALDVSGMLKGNLKIRNSDHSIVDGILEMNKFPVTSYLGRFPQLSKVISEGNLFGAILLSGTTDQPMVQFDIGGENFIINQNGYYSASLKGEYQKSQLSLEEANVKYNNRPVVEAGLKWDILNDRLEATCQGENFESNFIASTLFRNPELIRGAMNYDLKILGNSHHPHISGSATMTSGILMNRNFHRLQILFEDSIPPAASLLKVNQHFFRINKFEYADEKDYQIEVTGIIPVNSALPLKLTLQAQGNILAELPNILSYFKNPNSLGELYLNFSGSRENVKIESGRLLIYNGNLEFESVIPPLKEIKADLELKEGESFIHIRNIEGKLENRFVRIYNLDQVMVNGISLPHWDFEDFGLNFGILVLETDHRGIPLSIPGLMNPGDIGFFSTEGKQPEEKFYFSGPLEKPQVRGKVILNESRVTFPFLVDATEASSAEEDKVLDFLMNISWDVKAVAGMGNRYFIDIPAIIDQAYLDLNIDNVSEGLEFSGRIADESFRVAGSVESTRGRVEYLDMNFRVERFGAIFNKFELFPEVYGRAWTTVRDSTNFPRDIYLVLYAIDPETQQEMSRGRWEDFRFKLVSSDPTIGETQENVLAYLGYSVENISNKASDIGVTITENLLIRPLVRPLERKMERGLRLDYVRLSLQITSNLFYYSLQPRWKYLPENSYLRYNYNTGFDPALLLLQSSEITLGKYLFKDFYFSYSGQLVSIYDEPKFGLNHRFGLEYRLLQNLLLEFEYDKLYMNPKFYSQDALHDFRIRFKHSFNF
jgi:hypothetical protein